MREMLKALFKDEQLCFEPNQHERYLQNVCAASKNIAGIVYPQSEEEVIKLIKICQNTDVPLYPISTGMNYGLGSRLPVEDDHLIVDLGQMNRILSFDADLGVIQIEPGVTQQNIADYLQNMNANFILNVTGSSAQSSVVGNALERGVGHYRSRMSEVVSLDVILGDGNKLSTRNLDDIYSHGLGPDLKGLFFQSNFGIVTSMSLRLLPKTQNVAIVSIEKKSSVPLEMFIDQLRIAKHKQLLPDNLHISNSARRLSVVTPLVARHNNISIKDAAKITKDLIQTDWSATTSLRGERIMLDTQIECLKHSLQQYAKITILFDTDLQQINNPILAATKGAVGHSLGVPCSDAILSLGYEAGILIDTRLEESDIGTLFLVPVIPFRGLDFNKVVECITTKFQEYHFVPYMTFNLIDEICLEGVINLTFLKSDVAAVTSAHSCITETLTALENMGYAPMRLSIFQKSSFLHKDKISLNLRKKLKTIFDPANIIAKGRYET